MILNILKKYTTKVGLLSLSLTVDNMHKNIAQVQTHLVKVNSQINSDITDKQLKYILNWNTSVVLMYHTCIGKYTNVINWLKVANYIKPMCLNISHTRYWKMHVLLARLCLIDLTLLLSSFTTPNHLPFSPYCISSEQKQL